MTTAYTIAKKTTLQITVASVLTDIGHVENLSFPNATLETIRAKALEDSFSTVLVSGVVEGGQVSVSLFHDPLDVQHQLLQKTVHSTDFATTGFKPSERKKDWAIALNQLTVPKSWLFTGVPTQYNITAAVGDVLKSSLTIENEQTTAFPV